MLIRAQFSLFVPAESTNVDRLKTILDLQSHSIILWRYPDRIRNYHGNKFLPDRKQQLLKLTYCTDTVASPTILIIVVQCTNKYIIKTTYIKSFNKKLFN